MSAAKHPRMHILETQGENIEQVVVRGLGFRPKRLPSYLLYDKRGSSLFEEICETPEYYLTRAESSLIARHGVEIAVVVASHSVLLEPGAGSMNKVRLLLRHFQRPITFMPIDISRDHLAVQIKLLADEFPGVIIEAVAGDFWILDQSPQIVSSCQGGLLFFPGSTIGNMEPGDAVKFMQKAKELLGPEGALLVGVDLIKDVATLTAAYNDAAGVTAMFIKNILVRINRELRSDFNVDSFVYRGKYNQVENRIEISLESTEDQVVTVQNKNFRFEKGEKIHLHHSYKYSVDSFRKLAIEAGLFPTKLWVDDRQQFSLHLIECSNKKELL